MSILKLLSLLFSTSHQHLGLNNLFKLRNLDLCFQNNISILFRMTISCRCRLYPINSSSVCVCEWVGACVCVCVYTLRHTFLFALVHTDQ